MTEVSSTGASLADVNALIAPVAATADGAVTKADAAMAAAQSGLTSSDRQQAVRVQVTPDANGRVTYTFPRAYAAGITPAVSTTAETPNGASYRNDASVEEGSATNTQVVLLVQRVPKTLVASVLGAVLNVLTPVTTPVWLNIFIRAPA